MQQPGFLMKILADGKPDFVVPMPYKANYMVWVLLIIEGRTVIYSFVHLRNLISGELLSFFIPNLNFY